MSEITKTGACGHTSDNWRCQECTEAENAQLKARIVELLKENIDIKGDFAEVKIRSIELQAKLERLEGKTGFCLQCEQYAKKDDWEAALIKDLDDLYDRWALLPPKEGK